MSITAREACERILNHCLPIMEDHTGTRELNEMLPNILRAATLLLDIEHAEKRDTSL